jgi:hypothetical protein
MTAEHIARALNGRKSGAGWMALCPAHDDHSPSLSITERGGKLLVRCRVGCEQRDVIAALRDRGLWPERDWTPAQRRDFAKDRRRDEADLRKARLFANAAHILAEQCLEELAPYDSQRAPLTRLVAILRSDAGMLSEYRDWRATKPTMTRALVQAGRKHRERLELLITNFFTREVSRAA